MGEANPSVLVIDDDPEFRNSVARLLRTVGFCPNFRLFPIFSGRSAGRSHLPGARREIAGASGLELQRDCRREQASADRLHTAHADVPMTVQAMKGGAIEFLTKPFRIRISLMLSRPASLAIVPVESSDKALRASGAFRHAQLPRA